MQQISKTVSKTYGQLIIIFSINLFIPELRKMGLLIITNLVLELTLLGKRDKSMLSLVPLFEHISRYLKCWWGGKEKKEACLLAQDRNLHDRHRLCDHGEVEVLKWINLNKRLSTTFYYDNVLSKSWPNEAIMSTWVDCRYDCFHKSRLHRVWVLWDKAPSNSS